jgi:hypothetical protein
MDNNSNNFEVLEEVKQQSQELPGEKSGNASSQ